MALTRIAQALLVCSLTWGALAFAGAYTWSSRPLALGYALAAAAAFAASRRVRVPLAPLALAFALIAAAIAAQLVPLPASLIARISPATLDAVQRLDLTYVVSGANSHALSIEPGATRQGLLLAGCFMLAAIAFARLLTLTGTRWIVLSITVLTVVLALIGVLQDVGKDGKVYGFWKPLMPESRPFGPFINRNHFGGWALMALPLALGLLATEILRAARVVPRGVRTWMLWLGSAEGARVLLLGSACAVIALGLIFTMSRSAQLCFVVLLVLGALFVSRRVPSTKARAAGIGILVLFAALVVAWVGGDTIVTRFESFGQEDVDRRRGAWVDALSVASAFPVTGTGLNTYSASMLLYQRHNLDNHYAQAHNDYLQLAAEGGAMLMVPAAIALAAFAVLVRRRFRQPIVSESSWWARAGAVTGLVSIGLQEAVEFSLQMPANAALFAVLCAIALHGAPSAAAARGGQPR